MINLLVSGKMVKKVDMANTFSMITQNRDSKSKLYGIKMT